MTSRWFFLSTQNYDAPSLTISLSAPLHQCASRQSQTIKYPNVRSNFCGQSWLRNHKQCYLYIYLHCVCHDLHGNKHQLPCWPPCDTNSNTNPPRGEYINDSAHVSKQLVYHIKAYWLLNTLTGHHYHNYHHHIIIVIIIITI